MVQTAKFKPGRQRDRAVRVKMSLPITFDLSPSDDSDSVRIAVSEEGVITLDRSPVTIEQLRARTDIDWPRLELIFSLKPESPLNIVDAVLEALRSLGAAVPMVRTSGSRPPLSGAAQPMPDGQREVFVIVEKMPELIGGLDGLQSSMVYPELAAKAGVQGRVIVQFIVNPDGSVSDAMVVRGIGAGCDEEALRVVRAARFNPGKQRDVAVPVKMSLPITFKLNDGAVPAPQPELEPFTGDVEVFTDASDVGRAFVIVLHGGPVVDTPQTLAEKVELAVGIGRQNECNAVIVGTAERSPRMGEHAERDEALRNLRPGQFVGIRYLKQAPKD